MELVLEEQEEEDKLPFSSLSEFWEQFELFEINSITRDASQNQVYSNEEGFR